MDILDLQDELGNVPDGTGDGQFDGCMTGRTLTDAQSLGLRPPHALSWRFNRSRSHQKKTIPFRSEYHPAGVMPIRHFRSASGGMGTWSRMDTPSESAVCRRR